MMTKCTLCERPHYGRGYCNRHYQNMRNAGLLPKINRLSNEERFWQKVNKTNSCWRWTAYKNSDGYGTFRFGEKMIMAHVFSYRLSGKKIAVGLELDHLCRTRDCVNPEHLEPVTHRVNSIRARLHSGRKNNLPMGVKPNNGKFQARIKRDGKETYLGSYLTIEGASKAYQEAREALHA